MAYNQPHSEWIPYVDGWGESGGDLSDEVVGDGSPFARTDDAEGCGDISLLCSLIWNI